MTVSSRLPHYQQGTGYPDLVLMHLFGSSKREWNSCLPELSQYVRCTALDLPGFGDAAPLREYTVLEMTCAVEETLRSLALTNIVLTGHSLSGKVALLLASRKKIQLAGLILISSSPPSPEPITAEGRTKMLQMSRDRKDASEFLDSITATPLAGKLRKDAISDFIRCSPEAWRAWLESGSREDLTGQIGMLSLPALVVSGREDKSLGPTVQEETTLRFLSNANHSIIEKCGHLATMEKPAELSSLITHFITDTIRQN